MNDDKESLRLFFKNLWFGFFSKNDHVPWIEARYNFGCSFEDGNIIRFWKPLTEMEIWIREMEKVSLVLPHNLHYTVAPRTCEGGGKKHVAGSSSFWMDVDENPDAIEKIMKSLSTIDDGYLLPSTVVNSGWGRHVFWHTDTVFDYDVVSEINRFLARYFRDARLGKPSSNDIQSSNADHLLRFPVGYNCKGNRPMKTGFVFLSKDKVKKGEGFLRKIEQLRSLCQTESTINIPKRTEQRNFPSVSIRILTWDILQKDDCPLLRKYFFSPETVSYKEWFSLCAAFNQVCGESGKELFLRISALDGKRYVETEAAAFWQRIQTTDMKASGCMKLDIPCVRLQTGQCSNLMTRLRYLESLHKR